MVQYAISHLPRNVDGISDELFVAIKGDKAIGSVTARFQSWRAVAVRMLWVHPAYRRQKIATSLMQRVEEWAQRTSADGIELSCKRGNAPARDFYLKLGFKDAPDRQPDAMIKPLP